jgi:hypothetical protein
MVLFRPGYPHAGVGNVYLQARLEQNKKPRHGGVPDQSGQDSLEFHATPVPIHRRDRCTD